MSRQEDRGRSATPSRGGGGGGAPAGGRGGSRSPSPLARQLFGDDLTAEEMEQYNELLDQFGGDEEALADAIEQFMQEYEKDPEAFERMMMEEEERQGGGGGGNSRSPSAGAGRR